MGHLILNKNSNTLKKDNTKNKINKENTFDKDLQLKKLYFEISRVKEEYNKLIVENRSKEEEILDLKKNQKVTNYNELKIKNEILSQEFIKLKEMYLLSLDMNKKKRKFGKKRKYFKSGDTNST